MDGNPKDNEPRPAENDVRDEAPKLPPYIDPKGRRIMPRHRQFALREARRRGLNIKDPNTALHKMAELGVNIFMHDESILDMAEDGKSSPEQPAPKAKKNVENLPAKRKPDASELMKPEQDQEIMKRAENAKKLQEERDAEIAKIQKGLVKRRRRRLFAMLLRLFVFVFLPTALVGYYYVALASDMYETNSEFVIQTTEASTGIPDLGGLLGTTSATSQDSTVVQGFLSSREAFLRLQQDFDYVAHFQDPDIDPIQRLPADATLDDAYSLYTRNVIISYDPAEGVIRMTVVAKTPQDSQKFSEALVGYAEDRVDGLTLEARGDQLADALARRAEAEQAVLQAQQRIVLLQQQMEVLSPEVELQAKMSIINSLQLELETRRLTLRQLLANERPNQSRVDVLRAEIAGYESRIAEIRSELTQPSGQSTSLASISAELRLAELDLATRQLILQEAISGAEAAQISADQQTRYISVSVSPIAPVEATYPKKLESTILAFLVFSGIYIMVSLTLSILREQVSL